MKKAMTDRDSDLIRLHAMAIQNTPPDAVDRVKSMNEYREHRALCVERYGMEVAMAAEYYGHDPNCHS